MVWFGRKYTGPTTNLLATYAKKYRMCIVVPIYEREMAEFIITRRQLSIAMGPF
jgi:hypothetical protein